MMSWYLTILVLASLLSPSDASPYSSPSEHHKNHQVRYIPSSLVENEEGNWVSLHPEIEFLPSNYYSKKSQQEKEQIAAATQQFLSYSSSGRSSRRNGRTHTATKHRTLEEGDGEAAAEEEQPASTSTREDNSQYRVQPFVEGVSDYDAYQQAWRMLGFMIDCNTVSAYDQSQSNNNNNNNNGHSNDNDGTGDGCTRYVLWAAYVDLGYEGGGIGEYQFWDPSSNSWDTSTCDYMKKVNGNSGRCAKMDCHVKNTHWSLLGFFKHKEIDEWMGQLFKHEGVCVWTADQYNFMKNARNAWPQACTNSGATTSDGEYIYYDIKPKHGGGITMGLYTDTKCVKEYQSTGKYDSITLENVVGNFLVNGGNSHSDDKNENSNSVSYETLSDALAAWDDAFSVWMQCQPCVAYDRHNYGYKVNDDSYHGSNYNSYRYGYDDDYAWNNYYSSKYGGSDFDCYDDADYTNVNQCMKFMAKTTMNTATFRDLAVATAQGTLVDQPLAGYYAARTSFGMSTLGTYLFFVASILLLIYGIIKFRSARRQTAKEASSLSSWNPKEPLVFA